MFRFALNIRKAPRKFARQYAVADDSFILEHAGRIQKKISHDWTESEVAKLFTPSQQTDEKMAKKFEQVQKARKEAAAHVMDAFLDVDEKMLEKDDLDAEDGSDVTGEEEIFQNRISFVSEKLKERIYGQKGDKTPKNFVFPEIEQLEREKYMQDLKKEDLSFWMDKSKRDVPLEPWHERFLKQQQEEADLEKFLNPSQESNFGQEDEDEIETNPSHLSVEDPGWQILMNLQPGTESEQVWNPTFLKILWEIVGGDSFVRPEEFFEQIKFGTKKEAMLEKLKIVMPKLDNSSMQAVLNKILGILQRDVVNRDSITESIRDLTTTVTESTAPVYFQWADRFKTLHPRGEAVEYALNKIMKKRVTAPEMKKAGEIAAAIDSSQYPYEIDYLYEVFRPLHEQKPMESIIAQKPKDRYPAIYGGKSFGWGKRKSSQAFVKIEPGTGLFYINGKQHDNYFKNPRDLYAVFYPLHAMGSIKDFDVSVRVKGGGTTGQSHAVSLALSRAIVKFIPALHGHMRKLGLLSSDGRRVERKKPGQKKARRRFQWVKR